MRDAGFTAGKLMERFAETCGVLMVGASCGPEGIWFCGCGYTGLREGVTDSGLSALASAGCGARLTSLTLWGE